ncbi:MAG: hypothetical protein JW846_01505 [Dehalococcoidia bacterium]|nr:hypothetical protein [Dehalococcoidia bacterium]
MYSYIKRDRSGLSHVDYLLLSSADLAVGGASKGADILPTIYRNLHDHKDGIESQVGLVGPRDRLKLLPRYYTLADYHNRFVGGISSSPGVRGSRRSKARREWELVDAIEQEALAREGYSEAETAQILSELDEIAAEFVKSLKTTRVDIRRLFKELNPR